MSDYTDLFTSSLSLDLKTNVSMTERFPLLDDFAWESGLLSTSENWDRVFDDPVASDIKPLSVALSTVSVSIENGLQMQYPELEKLLKSRVEDVCQPANGEENPKLDLLTPLVVALVALDRAAVVQDIVPRQINKVKHRRPRVQPPPPQSLKSMGYSKLFDWVGLIGKFRGHLKEAWGGFGAYEFEVHSTRHLASLLSHQQTGKILLNLYLAGTHLGAIYRTACDDHGTVRSIPDLPSDVLKYMTEDPSTKDQPLDSAHTSTLKAFLAGSNGTKAHQIRFILHYASLTSFMTLLLPEMVYKCSVKKSFLYLIGAFNASRALPAILRSIEDTLFKAVYSIATGTSVFQAAHRLTQDLPSQVELDKLPDHVKRWFDPEHAVIRPPAKTTDVHSPVTSTSVDASQTIQAGQSPMATQPEPSAVQSPDEQTSTDIELSDARQLNESLMASAGTGTSQMDLGSHPPALTPPHNTSSSMGSRNSLQFDGELENARSGINGCVATTSPALAPATVSPSLPPKSVTSEVFDSDEPEMIAPSSHARIPTLPAAGHIAQISLSSRLDELPPGSELSVVPDVSSKTIIGPTETSETSPTIDAGGAGAATRATVKSTTAAQREEAPQEEKEEESRHIGVPYDEFQAGPQTRAGRDLGSTEESDQLADDEDSDTSEKSVVKANSSAWRILSVTGDGSSLFPIDVDLLFDRRIHRDLELSMETSRIVTGDSLIYSSTGTKSFQFTPIAHHESAISLLLGIASTVGNRFPTPFPIEETPHTCGSSRALTHGFHVISRTDAYRSSVLLQEAIRTGAVVIPDHTSPSGNSLQMIVGEMHASFKTPLDVLDYSIKTEPVRRKATIRQFFDTTSGSNSKILSLPCIPIGLGGLESLSFACERAAMDVTNGIPGLGTPAALTPHLRYGSAAAAGTLEPKCMAPDGFGIIIDITVGSVFVVVWQRSTSLLVDGLQDQMGWADSFVSEEEVHFTQQNPEIPFFQPCSVVVEAGGRIIIPPNMIYSVYTIEASATYRRHFLSTGTLYPSFCGRVHCFVLSGIISRAPEPATQVVMIRLLAFFYDAIIKDEPSSDYADHINQHLPNFNDFEGVQNFFSLLNMAVFYNALHPLTYAYPASEASTPTAAAHEALIHHDLNAIPLQERKLACTARAMALALADAFFRRYRLIPSETGDTSTEIDGETDFWHCTTMFQAIAMVSYKANVDKLLRTGQPLFSPDALRRQVRYSLSIFPPRVLTAFDDCTRGPESPSSTIVPVTDMMSFSGHFPAPSFAFETSYRVERRKQPLAASGTDYGNQGKTSSDRLYFTHIESLSTHAQGTKRKLSVNPGSAGNPSKRRRVSSSPFVCKLALSSSLLPGPDTCI
ncbi:hypothetical protein BKA70DRAFT_1417331 [Coprinopsis sp. MPI-PUGE-AT-0042]|nr:hypothetical protein BKA70DRAFT_1417331 [Coprinopsis sp. MPI-PUGE-AT-0042]